MARSVLTAAAGFGLAAAVVLVPVSPAEAEPEVAGAVGASKTVTLDYTLTLEDGTVVHTSEGGEPMRYLHGAHEIFPALEAALVGMEVDETRSVTLTPEQAYGTVDPELVQEVPTSAIPEDARAVDTQLVTQDAQGHRRIVTVREVGEDTILLDLNHPLAGETLHVDVRILSIEQAPALPETDKPAE